MFSFSTTYLKIEETQNTDRKKVGKEEEAKAGGLGEFEGTDTIYG